MMFSTFILAYLSSLHVADWASLKNMNIVAFVQCFKGNICAVHFGFCPVKQTGFEHASVGRANSVWYKQRDYINIKQVEFIRNNKLPSKLFLVSDENYIATGFPLFFSPKTIADMWFFK